jgi:hypothetical protein
MSQKMKEMINPLHNKSQENNNQPLEFAMNPTDIQERC